MLTVLEQLLSRGLGGMLLALLFVSGANGNANESANVNLDANADVKVNVSSNPAAGDIVLPLTLDHNLLTALLVHTAFPEKGETAYVVGEGNDCMQVTLEEPQYSAKGELLQLEMKLFIRAGKEFGENCLLPVEWKGYLELLQRPYITKKNKQGELAETGLHLAFQTIDSRLITEKRQPAKVAGFLWKFAKPEVNAHLDRVRIDLAPPLQELRNFLPMIVNKETRIAASAMFSSLDSGKVEVHPDSLLVELLIDSWSPSRAEALDDKPMQTLTKEEKQRFVSLWETWDVLLVHLLTTLAANPLTEEDRLILIDVLLQTRHAMVRALENDEVSEDLVRKQFIMSWNHLAPVFRRQLYLQPSDNSLGYLAFFTAADALAVLDELGPVLGIEISEAGFLRLAKMLGGQEEQLQYSPEADAKLRELFQMVPEPPPSALPEGEAVPVDRQEQQDQQREHGQREPSPLSYFSRFLLTPLYAATNVRAPSIPQFSEILKWKVPKKNSERIEHVERVKTVLDGALKNMLVKEVLPDHLRPMMSVLIPAIAWQESCFRQFVVKNTKLTYLLSYNNSSVGVMQINERVWRGFYNRQRLRWDIHYNALAGCEIVALYLKKYALKKGDWQGQQKIELLSKILYSMYNGGPGQYQKFLAREDAGNHYKSDQLFAEKLQWVLQGQWQQAQLCYLGS